MVKPKTSRRLSLTVAALSVATVVLIAWIYARASRYDLLITNAHIVDGSGSPQFNGDIAVKDGRIVRIGTIPSARAARIIDAGGQTVAPGFIDIHTHVEEIRRLPAAENFIRMGVTTVVTGNCGSSVADLSRFLRGSGAPRPAINVASLVGHNTIRELVMGLDDREPTPAELQSMKTLVEQAMKDGAFGFSTGLVYVPGAYAKTDEIISLARVAAKYGGIYSTHMRDEGVRVKEAVNEAIQVGEEAHIPVEISHFKVTGKTLWQKSGQVLELVRKARERGLSVTLDQYAYTASSTSLDVLLPKWVRKGSREETVQRLEDPDTRARVVAEMKQRLAESGFMDYSYAVVASYELNVSFNGKSIAEITKMVHGQSGLDDQIAQILDMCRAGFASMIYHEMSEGDVREIMRDPFTAIASDSGVRIVGEDVPHPRGYGNNARVLGLYVRELGLITLEDAVRKMTSLPARIVGFHDRGLIREGLAADLVIFNDATVADRATFEQPNQYPVGISYVVVNGTVVLANGVMSADRPGKMLRRGNAPAE